jgi:ankyrin repeat protein
MRCYQYLLLVLILGLLALGMWRFYEAAYSEPPTTSAEKLWQAVAALDAAAVQTLLEESPDYIRGANEHGRTLLDHALRQGRDDDEAILIVGLLIEWGAEVDAANEQGETPLHVAASLGLPNVARSLVAAGASLAAEDISGRTPLDIAEEFRLDQYQDIGQDKRLQNRRRAVADFLRDEQLRNESMRDAE